MVNDVSFNEKARAVLTTEINNPQPETTTTNPNYRENRYERTPEEDAVEVSNTKNIVTPNFKAESEKIEGVEFVKENNNAQNTIIGTGLGLGIGGIGAGAYGYYSRPFLKDGTPTKAFTEEMNKEIKNTLPEEVRQGVEKAEQVLKDNIKALDEATTVEELKNKMTNINLKKEFEEYFAYSSEDRKAFAEEYVKQLKELGMENTEEIEKILKCNSMEEYKELLEEGFNKDFKGKSLEEIKEATKKELKMADQKSSNCVFKKYWNSSKKAFEENLDDVGKAVEKAAKKIQKKTAVIYAGIGAFVLGTVGYLLAPKNKNLNE